MIGGLVETGIFKLKEMLDNVLAKRPRRPQIAASQILDLLGYVFEVDFVPHRRQTAQQLGLLLRPSVEVFLVKRLGRRVHLPNIGKLEHRGKSAGTNREPWYTARVRRSQRPWPLSRRFRSRFGT